MFAWILNCFGLYPSYQVKKGFRLLLSTNCSHQDILSLVREVHMSDEVSDSVDVISQICNTLLDSERHGEDLELKVAEWISLLRKID